jgi:hypothetical protein
MAGDRPPDRGAKRTKRTRKKGEAILDPQTGQPYIECEYSDALLMFMIKAHRPEYRDTFKNEHSGADGGPIEFAEFGANGPTSPSPKASKAPTMAFVADFARTRRIPAP